MAAVIFIMCSPEKSTGSCGMTAMTLLSVLRPTLAMFTLSMVICPSASSTSRSRAVTIELFPAPVRPTMPIFSLELTTRLRLLSTLGRPGR